MTPAGSYLLNLMALPFRGEISVENKNHLKPTPYGVEPAGTALVKGLNRNMKFIPDSSDY
jgi:hypothetical protein